MHHSSSNTLDHSQSIQNATNTFHMPLMTLLFKAHTIHSTHFEPNEVQVSTLLSIKTGLCPENCSYCPQSVHHNTGLKKEPLLDRKTVIEAAKRAIA